MVKDWHKLKSVINIQLFLGFANFNYYFIKSFNKIAILLSIILKTTKLFTKSALIAIEIDVNKVVGIENRSKPGLFRFKKMKIIKSKHPAKSKNSTNLPKS